MTPPITTNAAPAAFLIRLAGMQWPMAVPATTPIIEARTRAALVARRTTQGRRVLAVMVRQASCVLSPISAKKIVPNVAKKTFQSMEFLLPDRFIMIHLFSLLANPNKGFSLTGRGFFFKRQVGIDCLI